MTTSTSINDSGEQPERTKPSSTRRETVTVASLVPLVRHVPPDTPVLIGINDAHRFNALLGELPVSAATVVESPTGPALLLQVDGVS